MAYLNNNKFKEIREAAKGGNEKALMILQAMRKMSPQGDLDRLVEDYYSVAVEEPQEEVSSPIAEQVAAPETEPVEQPEVEQVETEQEMMEGNTADYESLKGILDKELTDLLDENELEDKSFSAFIGDKKRNGIRANKNGEYFKAYDLDGRTQYMNEKISAYKDKFNDRLKDSERRYNDIDKSLSLYSTGVNDMLDDGVELDMSKVFDSYNKLTDNSSVMGSFGRFWDDNDNASVVEALKELIAEYGKANVLAALNTLKSDNENYRNYLNNQVDTEIGRYSKSIESLLK